METAKVSKILEQMAIKELVFRHCKGDDICHCATEGSFPQNTQALAYNRRRIYFFRTSIQQPGFYGPRISFDRKQTGNKLLKKQAKQGTAVKSFAIPDPDYKQRVKDSFSRQGFMAFIGARITTVNPGYCEIEVPHTPQLTQQHGFFHAGVIGTIVDNAGGYAAYTLMDEDSSILTVEYKINFIAPGQGEILIGRGRVVRAGRKLSLCRCDAFVVSNGQERHCAASQMTLVSMPNFRNKP